MAEKTTAEKIRVIAAGETALFPCFPGAVARGEYTDFSVVAAKEDQAALLLYNRGEMEPVARFAFPKEGFGNLRCLTVAGIDRSRMEYVLELGGEEQPDPCSRIVYGRPEFGRGRPGREQQMYHGPKEAQTGRRQRWAAPGEEAAATRSEEESGGGWQGLRSGFSAPFYDWEKDELPAYSWSDSILYQLHVRGFTMDDSSGVKAPGTFAGLVEKIPYLKELGITAVELQPVYDFDENGVAGPVNYWGYTGGYFFAPKSAYCDAGLEKSCDVQMKDMVKALHQAGIEVILQFFFPAQTGPELVSQVLRFWALEYHVDGFRVMGTFPWKAVQQDPVLAGRKLINQGWDPAGCASMPAVLDGGFTETVRRLVRGDEDQLPALAHHIKNNPAKWPPIHLAAEYAGFTLKDLVSYETKHNEPNGEGNRDGCWYNFSENCGIEGPAADPKIRVLRLKQRMNALLLVFLSQGVPLIQAGDEMGHSKGGNNNSWCQDNGVNWLNWNILEEEDQKLQEFVRELIAFRREHDVFHRAEEVQCSDYRSLGMPDFSLHGVHPWLPQYENFRRQLGVLYNGFYGTAPVPDSFYVMFNFHNTAHSFDLPKAPGGGRWHVKLDTSGIAGADSETDFEERPVWARSGEEPSVEGRTMEVSPRTVVIVIGKRVQDERGTKRRQRGRGREGK